MQVELIVDTYFTYYSILITSSIVSLIRIVVDVGLFYLPDTYHGWAKWYASYQRLINKSASSSSELFWNHRFREDFIHTCPKSAQYYFQSNVSESHRFMVDFSWNCVMSCCDKIPHRTEPDPPTHRTLCNDESRPQCLNL